MQKRILLMCALLISVITLSGAANRSFRTEIEQWNPIGFTQASNGMTQAQSGPQITNRLTAGSAILPTVATAAPSGVLRGGSANVITFKTSKKNGEKIKLAMKYSGAAPTLSGATRTIGTPMSGIYVTYTLTSQTVTITGDVTELYCNGNQLTTLDVSKNTVLTRLDCYNNQLTALDLSHNTALTILDCSYNQLIALDVSQNIALKWLDCSDNQLKALDVSNNTALTTLSCGYNQLTALDVSKNTELDDLNCYGNQIKGEEMTRLVNSLPDRTGMEAGEFTVVQEPDLEGNICLNSDVAIAKGKNWITQKYNSKYGGTVVYGGEDASPNIMSFYTAKAVGETVMLNMYYSGAAPTLSGATGIPENGEEVTYTLTSQTVTITGDVAYFDCSKNQLTALDVSKNTALTEFDCFNNQLTTLDVSKNTALTSLRCSYNQLTTLDVSQNTKLGALDCRGNQIKGEEMTRLVNSLPDCTGKFAGTFTVVQEPDLEGNICLKSDVAIAKGKNWKTQKYNSDTNKYFAYEGAEEGQTLKVTLTKEGEGTITATGATDLNAVPLGTELTIVATPADGYGLKALTANGTDILATKKFTVTADTEVKAIFTNKTYAVTLTKEGEGTITATGAADLNAVPEGTELTIVATPAAGYEVKALTANGTDILATKKIVVTDNMTVKATFTKKSYTVTFTPEGEGKLTATKNGEPFTTGSPAYEGDKIVITAQPAEGYQIDKWLIGKEEIEFTPYTGQTTFECTVGTADVLIKATFAKKTAADVVESSSVRLYPNPASTYVNVKGAKADALVRLYDANGTLRYEARTDADGTLQIDLSAYTEGIYLLRVGNDAQRLLIQR